MAEEEREKMKERENARRERMENEGPPPVANSRFAAAAEADRSYARNNNDDRGPPPVANSRFAMATETDRSYGRNNDDRGPPPIANSRFAAAAEADRSYQRNSDDRGPPPITNSRFAAAAEADGSGGGRSPFAREDRGPPPVANSRFAAAALRADEERIEYEERRRERDSFYNRDDQRGPVSPQNSRFAAAAAADSDYVDRNDRDRGSNDRNRFNDHQSGGRFGGASENRAGAGFRGAGAGDYGRNRPVEPEEPPPPQQPSRIDELLKPKKPPLEDNILKPPTKEHEANMLKIPDKPMSKPEETFTAAPPKQKVEVVPSPVEVVAPVPIAAVSAQSMEELLSEFSSGGKLGDELKAWCEENKPTLPSVEKLVFRLLKDNEKLNPDPDCAWADPSKYGSALLSLVEDDLFNQMQILWAIQLYCDTLGFPKLDGESVVQSMFRAMYKFDLADGEAFTEWKEDESDVHEKGKMTAIVQTMDWFNWLEADDDEEGEDDEEEEEE
jgi:eIF4-gamma/eIF5/eIF2-epsilon